MDDSFINFKQVYKRRKKKLSVANFLKLEKHSHALARRSILMSDGRIKVDWVYKVDVIKFIIIVNVTMMTLQFFLN